MYRKRDEIDDERGMLVAARELKQIERQLILYDIFQQNTEDTRISTIMFHLPGMNLRMLQRDVRDLTDAGVIQVYFSRAKKAYINCDEYRDISEYSEGIQRRIVNKRKTLGTKEDVSLKKKEHFERLQRLTTLMSYEVYQNAKELYFNLFPETTERMRKRDFEVLRHIGFCAGYDSDEKEYVLYRDERYGIDNDYGIRIHKNTGKMVYFI